MDISSYKRYCQQLDLSKFNDDVDQACMFYFRMLQELGVEIATVRGQIEDLKTMLAPSKGNLGSLKLSDHEQEEGREKKWVQNDSHSEEQNQFYCDYKGCDQCYEKNSKLTLHKMLKHRDPSVDFSQGQVFRVGIKDISEGRRPSRY